MLGVRRISFLALIEDLKIAELLMCWGKDDSFLVVILFVVGRIDGGGRVCNSVCVHDRVYVCGHDSTQSTHAKHVKTNITQ